METTESGMSNTTARDAAAQVFVPLRLIPFFKARILVAKIVLPLILLFGTFGNVMIIIIMRRMRSAVSSLSVYFTVLAVSDLIGLYTNFMFNLVLKLLRLNLSPLGRPGCKLIALCLFLTEVTGLMSAWTLVIMTAQRATSVLWPHRVNVFCTRRKSLLILLGTFLFSACINFHIVYGHDVIYISNTTRKVCTYVGDDHIFFMKNVWPWISVVSFSLLPFCLIVASNSLLVKTLIASVRENTLKLSAIHSDQTTSRQRKVSSVTLTLVVVSAAFIVLSLPDCIRILVRYLSPPASVADDLKFLVAIDFLFEVFGYMWNANSAVNFYLYCLTGAKFRAECLCVLTCNGRFLRKQAVANAIQ